MIKRIMRNLLRSRARSLLTMCGIAVGVFAVVLISAIGEVGTNEITSALAEMGINSALVEPNQGGSGIVLTDEDVESFAGLDGVSKAMPLMASTTQSKLLGETVACFAWGVDEDAKDIISLEALHGRLIDDGDVQAESYVCVIDEEIALETYGRSNIVGKKIKILLGGSYREFEIAGVAKSGISALQNVLSGIIPNFVYIPYSTMQTCTGRSGFDKIALLLDEDKAQGEFTEALSERVNELKNTGNLVVSNLLHQKTQLTGVMSTVTMILSMIAAISLFVSGITVMTTMMVTVSERTREIGIKKSLGARNSDIMLEFLLESTAITTAGCAAGTLLAVLLTAGGCMLLGVSFTMSMGTILTAVGVSVGMGVLFGAYPAAKAAKLPPVEALRN